MARLCVQRGHQAVVFGNHGGLLSSRETSHDGVEYVFTPTGRDRLLNRMHGLMVKVKTGPRATPGFCDSWHHRGYAEAAACRARSAQCDIVHVMNYSQFVPVVRKYHPQARIALHMQCEWLTQLNPALIKPRIDQADLIIGCSEYITRKIIDKFPEYAGRCVTVPNAADAVAGGGQTHSPGKAVIFVGRLSPEKGVHDLVRAFHTVLERFPDARLHLVGGAGSAPLEFLVGLSDEPHVTALRRFYGTSPSAGKDPYLEVLEREAGSELGTRILFDGRVNHDQLESHYGNSCLLVNPSLSESFGISLVEAMMRGIPVVATRVGGMQFTVAHGQTGFLVEPADPPALAAAMCEMLANPERARRMGAAGKERATDYFSWEKTANTLLNCMRRTAESA